MVYVSYISTVTEGLLKYFSQSWACTRDNCCNNLTLFHGYKSVAFRILYCSLIRYRNSILTPRGEHFLLYFTVSHTLSLVALFKNCREPSSDFSEHAVTLTGACESMDEYVDCEKRLSRFLGEKGLEWPRVQIR